MKKIYIRNKAINDFVETIVAPDIKRARENGIDVSQEQIDKVKSDQRTRTEEFVDAIEAKDFGPLKDRLHRGNKASLKLFSAITGLSTKTQKETNENIRALDPVKYDKWVKFEKQKFDKAMADKKAADKEKAYKAMLEAHTNYDSNGKPITFEQHIKSLLDNGYTDIEITEGKFPTTKLIKYESGGKGRRLVSQVFRRKIEQEYVQKMQDHYVEARIAEDIAEEEKDQAENPDKYLSDEEAEHLFTRGATIKKSKN